MTTALRATLAPLAPAAPTATPCRKPTAEPAVGFAEELRVRTVRPPAIEGDVDGDGKISKEEALLMRIRSMIDRLQDDLASTIGDASRDPRRMTAGIVRLARLADALQHRIEDKGTITETDLEAIAKEASEIALWARQPPTGPQLVQEGTTVDGRVFWHEDRVRLADMLAERIGRVSGTAAPATRAPATTPATTP